MEIRASDIKAMDMRRNDREEEEYAVQYEVPAWACHH